jgi:hypothetical protein
MKKNLILLGLLSLIIAFTFFWEEKGGKNAFNSSRKNGKLIQFDLSTVTQLTLKKTKLYIFKKKWMVGEINFPANKNYVDQVLKTLNGLVIVKEIKELGNIGDFFKYQNHSFSIKSFNGERFFRLGDISEVTGEFYLEETINGSRRLYLMKDINSYEGVYKSEKEAEFQKYVQLVGIIRLSALKLATTTVIPNDIISEIQSVKIDEVYKDSTIIDFRNKTIVPALYKSLNIKNPYDSFLSLNNSKVISLYELDNSKLSLLYKSILIKISGGIEVPLYLYNMYNGKKGYFISHPVYKKIIQIDSVKNSLFSLNQQLFLDKRFSLFKSLIDKKSFEFTLFKSKKRFNFKIKDVQSFVYSSAHKFNKESLNMLFNILLNNKRFTEADFIAPRESVQLSPQISLSIEGQEYSLSLKNGIINILEHSSNTIFTFIRSEIPLKSFNIEEFIYNNTKKASN